MAEEARGRYNRLSMEVEVLGILADPDSIISMLDEIRSRLSDYKLVGRPGKYLLYTPSLISLGRSLPDPFSFPLWVYRRMDHSLTNVLAANQFSSDVVPTVAFNLKQVKKGNVNMKIWDLGVSLVLLPLLPMSEERLGGQSRKLG